MRLPLLTRALAALVVLGAGLSFFATSVASLDDVVASNVDMAPRAGGVASPSDVAAASLPSASEAGTEVRGPAALPLEPYALVDTWDPQRPPMIYHPEGVDVGTDGLLVVAETGNDRVAVWSAKGEQRLLIGGRGSEQGSFLDPQDVAVDVGRDRIWVADTGNRRLQVFTRRTGTFLAEWTDVGLPTGITSDSDGRVYVADGEASRVRAFDSDGALLATWGSEGSAAGSLETPMGLAAGADGWIYVADHGNQRVQWFTPQGELVGALNLDNSAGPGGAPYDVAVKSDGTLYVAVERGILRYRSRSMYAETIPPLEPAEPEPIPLEDNFEGVRRVAYRDGVGMAFSFAPRTRDLDRIVWHPDRWYPDLFPEIRSGTGPFDPYRIDTGSGTLAHVLDTSDTLRLFELNGRVYDGFHWFPANGDADVAGTRGVACRLCGEGPITAVLDENALNVVWNGCFSDCPTPPPVTVLTENMTRRQDCRGELVPDDRWWNTDISSRNMLQHAVLNAGYGSVVVRDYTQETPVGVVSLTPQTRAREAYSDLQYDGYGALWVLSRKGELTRIDGNGRKDEPLTLAMSGRSAEALAVTGSGEYFVLTHDERILKFAADGALLADWSIEALAGPGTYRDVAATEDGRVLVPDADADRILVFAPGPAPAPESPASECAYAPTKTASPSTLPLGDTTRVTLGLSGACPSTALDIVLVVDAGCEMSGDRLRWVREAGAAIAGSIDPEVDRVALVSFTTEYDGEYGGTRLELPLTGDPAAIAGAIGTFSTTCLPLVGEGRPMAIEDGLRGGYEALFGPAERAESTKVVVLLAPGRARRDLAVWQAQRLWEANVRILTVALPQDSFCAGRPPDEGLLAALASPPTAYRELAGGPDLAAALIEMLDGLTNRGLLEHLTVTDWIPANMRLVPGSVAPPAEQLPDGSLRWRFDSLEASGMPPLRYDLEPLAAGIWPTNVEAVAEFTDPMGASRGVTFPVPMVEVLAPTPTPTATPSVAASPTPTSTATLEATAPPTETPPPTAPSEPSPTASSQPSPTPVRLATVTPTSAPPRLFLPALFAPPDCVPKTVPVDIALVIDISSSMTGPKLAAAKDAADLFLGLTNFSRDRAGIVAFDGAARVVTPLTSNRAALSQALQSLQPGVGTRIDLGLREAMTMVVGQGARPEADPVIVLLTDGRPDEGTVGDLRLLARMLSDLGVATFAIGLGSDVDAALLAEITSQGDRVFLAPHEADLRRIYSQVAREIPCR